MSTRATALKGYAIALAGGLAGSLVGSLAVAAASDRIAGAVAPCLGTDGIVACPESELLKLAGAYLGAVFIGCGAGASLAVGFAGRGGAAATGLGAVVFCLLGFTLLTQVESVMGLEIPRGWEEPAMVALLVLSLLAARRIAALRLSRAARKDR